MLRIPIFIRELIMASAQVVLKQATIVESVCHDQKVIKRLTFITQLNSFKLRFNIWFFCLMGGYRSIPQTSKLSIFEMKVNTSYAVKEMCGWRTFQEDTFIVQDQLKKHDDLSLFAIFDGHAGSNVAIYARRHFVAQFLSHQDLRTRQFDRILCDTFMKLDEKMQTQEGKKELLQIYKQELAKQNTSKNEDPQDSGCTALVCLISPLNVYVANAGDSRAICSVKGELLQLSNDHKPQNPAEKKRIMNAGGYVQKGRVNGDISTSRGLGDFSFKRNNHEKKENQIMSAYPEVKQIRKKDIDFIFMGCDGVWEQKSSQQMKNYISEGLKTKQMDKVLENLLDQLISKDADRPEGRDNMTAILIKVNDT